MSPATAPSPDRDRTGSARPADDALGARLRRLDGTELAALVADLWAARGFDTERTGGRIVARRAGERIVIAVPAVGDAVDPTGGADPDGLTRGRGPDVVVATGATPETGAAGRQLDTTDLRQLLLYAIDRPVADDLAARHLGAPLGELRPPLSARAGEWLGTVATGTAAFAAVFVALVAVAGVAGLAVVPGPADTAEGDGSVTPASGKAVTPVPVPTPGQSGAASPFPPGVDRSGIANLDALAAAHERAVESRSYTVWVDWTSPERPGSDGPRVRRDIDVATDGSRYTISVDEVDAGTGNRTRLGRLYHDGGNSYVANYNRSTGLYSDVRVLDAGDAVAVRPAGIAETVVLRYLSTPRTNVTDRLRRDGVVLYRIVARGQPNAPRLGSVRNYTAVALVDTRGFLRSVDIEYVGTGFGTTYPVDRQVTYGRVGETSVTPPAWYERWRRANASAA